jgi:hypothetical protein
MISGTVENFNSASDLNPSAMLSKMFLKDQTAVLQVLLMSLLIPVLCLIHTSCLLAKIRIEYSSLERP